MKMHVTMLDSGARFEGKTRFALASYHASNKSSAWQHP